MKREARARSLSKKSGVQGFEEIVLDKDRLWDHPNIFRPCSPVFRFAKRSENKGYLKKIFFCSDCKKNHSIGHFSS
jgi:hypothetical protein